MATIRTEIYLALKNEIMYFKENGCNFLHPVKWNKSVPPTQMLHIFFHMWNLASNKGQKNKRVAIRDVEVEEEIRRKDGKEYENKYN